MSMTTNNMSALTRANLWSEDLKEIAQEELMGQAFVRMLTDFPDGEVLNIPSIGQAEVSDYVENTDVQYSALDTGNFQFQITDYKQSGHYITNKTLQDSYKASEVLSMFVPLQRQAMLESIETAIMATGPNGQTAGNSNTINGAKHRFVAGGTNAVLIPEDFAKAKHALKKAHMPMTNLVAVVDPSVEYHLSTLTNLTDLSYNPRWEGIIETGLASGMRFIRNIYGFDVYVSDFLKKNVGSETIDSVSVTGGVNNIFFSATGDQFNPIVGVMRQPIKVDGKYNMDKQREEYVTTARWGFALYRPENMVTVLSSDGQVYG